MKAITYSLLVWIPLISFLVFQDCKAPVDLSYVNAHDFPSQRSSNDQIVAVTKSMDENDLKADSKAEMSGHSDEQFINPLTDLALVALKKTKCAGCHTKSLPTANEGALAIFDLDDTPWHLKFKEEHHPGFTRRITEEAIIPDADKKLLMDFIGCQKSKDCQSDL